MSFTSDLALGNQYEQQALLYLDHDEAKIIQGYHKEYDMWYIKDGKRYTVEVKCDRLSHKTGNVVIEYQCSGKPSGITSTKADFWMYFIIAPEAERCYKIPTANLRKLIVGQRTIKGGDGKRSHMKLLKASKLEPYLITKIQQKNLTYGIPPATSKLTFAMANQEAKTNDQQPKSYTDRLIEQFKTDKSYTKDEVEQLIREFSRLEYERKKANYTVMAFGKYKYKKVADIAKFDAPYLTWCMKQDFMNNYDELKAEIRKCLAAK